MSSITSAVVFLVNILFFVVEANAYIVAVNTRSAPRTALNAWTLPKPTNRNSFDTFKPSSFSASWYDDHHPTARKIVYNDFDQEDNFVVSFKSDDWMNLPDVPAQRTSEVKTRRTLSHIVSNVYKRFKTIK